MTTEPLPDWASVFTSPEDCAIQNNDIARDVCMRKFPPGSAPDDTFPEWASSFQTPEDCDIQTDEYVRGVCRRKFKQAAPVPPHQRRNPTPAAPPRTPATTGKQILCIGDSLTAGYDGIGSYHPYSLALGRLLGVNVTEIGMSGWTSEQVYANGDGRSNRCTFGELKPGFRVALQRRRYQLVLIMLGTNDVGYNVPAAVTAESVQKIAADCQRRHGVRVVILTPLFNRFVQNDPSYKARFQVTIDALCAMAKRTNLPVLPCHKLMPYNERVTGHWAADGLHLTPQGSDYFGSVLARALSDLGVFRTPRR